MEPSPPRFDGGRWGELRVLCLGSRSLGRLQGHEEVVREAQRQSCGHGKEEGQGHKDSAGILPAGIQGYNSPFFFRKTHFPQISK